MTEKSWAHRLFFDAYFEDALMKMRSATGLGATYALFNALNEYFYEHGYIDERGYQYHKEKYGLPLVEDLERRLDAEEESLAIKTRQKELALKKLKRKARPDYSKMNIEQLQKEYDVAKNLRDTTTTQLCAFEMKKRKLR